MSKRRWLPILLALLTAMLLGACSKLDDPSEKIDPPQTISYGDKKDSNHNHSDNSEEATKSIKTELYLIDKNGYVVPQTFELPETKSVARQALEYLVENGPISNMLPNGFRAVLPAETQVSVDIQDGVAIVDFSNEFKNYKPEDEQRILQSVTWTLTQFDTINSVKLKLNGKELSEMPVNGTPIMGELTRKMGINVLANNVADLSGTSPITVYYLSQNNEDFYYVPVTKRVKMGNEDKLTATVQELMKNPGVKGLFTEFMADAKLIEKPKVEEGKVTLNFNENILDSFEKKVISETLLNALVLSLTEHEGIKSVSVLVNGEAELVNSNGQPIAEPVTRPENVNTGSF